MTAPSAYVLQRVISEAQQALVSLRDDHGVILDGPQDVLDALADEGIDAAGLLRRLGQAALDAKAYAAAAEDRISDLEARRDRFKRQEAKYRELLLMAMMALGMNRFPSAEFNLSVSSGRPRVVITDEAALPDDLVTVKVIRTPDKTAIKSALEIGEVPGAILSNAVPVLTVRAK